MARMGSGESGAPGKPIKIKRAAPPKPKAVVRRSTPAPVTDVQSSGGDYGTKKAAAYQRTPAANKPVIVASKQIVRNINTGKSKTVVVKQAHVVHPAKDLLNGSLTKVGDFLLHAFATGGGTAPAGGADLTKGSHGTTGATIGPMLGGPQGKVEEAIKANAKEAWNHPGRTIKDFGGMVAGTVGAAGDVGLPLLHAGANLATLHPGSALKDVEQSGKAIGRFATGAIKDYKYRYGPLVAGDYKTYEKRVHQAGAARGLVDLATVATGGGAAARALGATKLLAKIPGGKAFLHEPRPRLRTSGGEAVSQTLSHKPTRVVLQRAQDKVRQIRQERPGYQVGKVRRTQTAEGIVEEPRRPALQPQNPVRKSVERHNRKVAKRGGTPVPVPKRAEEVVPLIRSGPLETLGAARAQRIAVRNETSKSYVLNKHDQAAEIGGGADRAYAALTPKQRRAEFHVVQGLLPIHGTAADIKSALADRERQIVAENVPEVAKLASKPKLTTAERSRLDSLVKGFKGAGRSVLNPYAELATVRYLQKHADEVFSPAGLERLQAFHAGEVARGKRVVRGDTELRPATAAARARRPQGEVLGVPYEPPVATATNAAERDTYNVAYAHKVKAAADAKGLPEPAYFKHEKRPFARVSSHTAANLSRAVKGPKATEMRLFREGRAVTSHEAYSGGLRETIKRKYQYPGVANIVRQHAFDWSRGPDGKGLTIEQLRDQLDKRRLRPEDVTFWQPGLVRGQEAQAFLDAAPALSALKSGTGSFDRTVKYVALPTHAAKELLSSTKPASKGARVAGRFQGLQSGLILGLNPSWSQMQLAANSLQSIVGAHGNVGDFIASSDWYKKLSPQERRVVDLAGGIGVYEGHANMPHLGSYQGGLSHWAEQVGQIPIVRVRGKAVRLTDLDPRTQIFRFDNAQNNYFRRVVLYNELKRQAYKDLIANTGHAQTALAAVSDLLKGRPGQTVEGQIGRVLKNSERVDQAAKYVDSVMGDYLRFTHRERSLIKPTVMFYGFLRYATKTLFYTLPIHHPLAAELALKLGQLHDDEIKKIFGNKDLPPWVYSRVFQYDDNGNVVRDAKTGLPLSIDLARINPLTGPATDVASEGPKAGFGLFSPLAQAAANVASGRVLTQNRPITVHGSAEQPHSLSLTDMVRVAGNELLSSTFPGRLLMPKGAQSDDALPGSPRPIKYKTAKAQAKQRIKEASKLTGTRALEQQLFPLFVPKPDTSGLTAGGGLTGKLDKQIAALNKKAKAMRAKPDGSAGAATENGGYATRAYADLQARIHVLEQQRQKALGVKPTKGVRVKRRPASSQDRQDARLQQQLDRLNNPDKALQDRLNRQLERIQVQSGG